MWIDIMTVIRRELGQIPSAIQTNLPMGFNG
jgi:hypothetical protein